MGAGYQAKMEVNLAYRQLRADILMQNSISFEIQCSPISDIEFDHRHNLYEKIGIKDVWVVGRRHFLHCENHRRNFYVLINNGVGII